LIPRKRVSHKGGAPSAVRLELSKQIALEAFRIDLDCACGHLLLAGAVVAQLASSKRFAFHASHRTEDSARDWPRVVQIATSCSGIKSRTRKLIHRFREGIFVEQLARLRIAGIKLCGEANVLGRAASQRGCAPGIADFEPTKSFTQP